MGENNNELNGNIEPQSQSIVGNDIPRSVEQVTSLQVQFVSQPQPINIPVQQDNVLVSGQAVVNNVPIVQPTNMPIEQVRKRYLSINDMHIRYLDDFVRKNNYEIHNFRNFYISAIYNAPIMIDSFYEEWVKEDMKRGAI